VIRPNVVGKLTSVQTRYVSAWGPLESNWRKRATQTEYEFTIPANATGMVELITGDPVQLRVNGKVADRAPGVIRAESKSGKAVLVLGSGHYVVSTPNPRAGTSVRVGL
jgi:hypothetical protein